MQTTEKLQVQPPNATQAECEPSRRWQIELGSGSSSLMAEQRNKCRTTSGI